MESGLHSALWLDLDAAFASPDKIEPLVASLAELIRPFRVDVVCGPLLGGAFLAQSVARIVGAEFWFTEPAPAVDGAGLFRARYRLPFAFERRLAHPRVAIVDDVMSAGSSARATYVELKRCADVVVVGTLLQLGTIGAAFFAGEQIPVAAVYQQPFDVWKPEDCPHCATNTPLEHIISQ